MRFLRTLVLLCCTIALLGLAGFVLGGSVLALPTALAGASSLVLALA